MARLYSNENFPLPAVEALRQLGHEVLTTQDAGQAGQALPDETVLAFARAENRIALTLNRKHFIRLHATHPEHAGIIVCSYDPNFQALAARIHTLLNTQADWRGHLARVNRPVVGD